MAKVTAPTTEKSKEKTKEKTGKPKEKKKKQGRYKLKLKGWLKTPADWAQFDDWAKVKALPRKIPEPEPIIRLSKPLSKIKKRIEILSKPVKKPDPSKMYRLDQSVSKKALKAKASKRIKKIAKPVIRPVIRGREFPAKIENATLNYKATPNIIKISQPRDTRPEECKQLAVALQQIEEQMEELDDETREREQKRLWRILKKAQHCPGLLTADQIRELVTETGVYRTAFTYEFTPWMEFLSMPSYRFLKVRDGKEEWKEYIVNEMEVRGKRALEEQIQREEKRRKLQEQSVVSDYEMTLEEVGDNQIKMEQIEETIVDVKKEPEEIDDVLEEEQDEEPEHEANEERRDDEAEAEDVRAETEVTQEVQDFPVTTTIQDSVKSEKVWVKKQKIKEKSDQNTRGIRVLPRATPFMDDEASRKRRAQKNAWRYEPPPWKDENYWEIKAAALKGPVPPRMAELAQPHIYKDTISRKNPFAVKKSALTSPVPPRMAELAKAPHPRDPVQRAPPRKKNKYRKPIFPMPPYGKKLPPVKPYKERECKPAEEPEEPKLVEEVKSPPDPIIFKPTIDPYFDPKGAERQMNARKAQSEAAN